MAKIREVEGGTPKIKRSKSGVPLRGRKSGRQTGGTRKKKARRTLIANEETGTLEVLGGTRKKTKSKKKVKKKIKKKGVRQLNDPGARDSRGRITPGTISNPAGLKPGTISLTAILKHKLAEVPEGEKRTRAEMLIDTLMDKAILEGNEKLIKETLDRVEGKVPDRLIAALGSTELQGIPDDVLLAAIGVERGEPDEEPPTSQEETEFVGPVQPEVTDAT